MKKIFPLIVLFTSFAIPAQAAVIPDAGSEAGEGLSVFDTIIWFIGLPALVWFVIWLLWSMPKWRKINFPQTGENWDPQPKN